MRSTRANLFSLELNSWPTRYSWYRMFRVNKYATNRSELLLGSLRNLTVWQQRQQLRSDLPMTLSHSSGSLLLPYTGMKFFSRALCGFHAFVHFVSVVVKRTGTVRQFSGPLRGFSDSASDPLFCHDDMLPCPADARLFGAFFASGKRRQACRHRRSRAVCPPLEKHTYRFQPCRQKRIVEGGQYWT